MAQVLRKHWRLPRSCGLPIRDAQAAYRDLSGLKITLTLCADGWHVDYDLTDPLSAGGGPHYVIDPISGRILAKRYEQ